jgi:hypothetical protein
MIAPPLETRCLPSAAKPLSPAAGVRRSYSSHYQGSFSNVTVKTQLVPPRRMDVSITADTGTPNDCSRFSCKFAAEHSQRVGDFTNPNLTKSHPQLKYVALIVFLATRSYFDPEPLGDKLLRNESRSALICLASRNF